MTKAFRSAKRVARRLLLAVEPPLSRRGLTVRAWRAWEGLLTTVGRRHDCHLMDGELELPPRALRVRVIAEADPKVFLETGKAEAAILADAGSTHGLAIEDTGRLLDFGCGCGRVTRHWSTYASLEVHGTDHDADLIAWVRTHLRFVRAERNDLAPPLPYPDDYFGIVYALSVFTHMTDKLARGWMAELERVIRPGGLLLFSALDQRQAGRLRPSERDAFARGESVVQFEGGLGTNMCVAYHPRAYIETITPGFELLSTRPIGPQELYVLRSRGSESQTHRTVAATDDG